MTHDTKQSAFSYIFAVLGEYQHRLTPYLSGHTLLCNKTVLNGKSGSFRKKDFGRTGGPDDTSCGCKIHFQMQAQKEANDMNNDLTHQNSTATHRTELGVAGKQYKFLRRREVEEITGLSRSTIYRLMKAGQFPHPVKTGSRAVRWRLSDIIAWMDSRPSTRLQTWSPFLVQTGHQFRSPNLGWRRNILRLAGNVVGPLLHKVSAAFEQVRPRVSLYGRTAEGVS